MDEECAALESLSHERRRRVTVWGLTVEAKVYKDSVTVNAGINNLFDEDYYARITNTGIDPAARRNFYGGVAMKF